jgi:hypothetical protein
MIDHRGTAYEIKSVLSSVAHLLDEVSSIRECYISSGCDEQTAQSLKEKADGRDWLLASEALCKTEVCMTPSILEFWSLIQLCSQDCGPALGIWFCF